MPRLDCEHISERIKRSIRTFPEATAFPSAFTQSSLNLLWVIPELIRAWPRKSYTHPDLDCDLEEYNKRTGAAITADAIFQLHWLRLINEQLSMPLRVQYMCSAFGGTHSIKLRPENEPIADFLTGLYHKKVFTRPPHLEDIQLHEVVESVMPTNAAEIIRLLQGSGILQKNDEGLWQFRSDHLPPAILGNTAAQLWTLVMGQHPVLDDFRRYIQLLYDFNIWPKQLADHLSGHHAACATLAQQFLLAEPDLLLTDDEFAKAAIDEESYGHAAVEQVQTHRLAFIDAYDVITFGERYIPGQNFWLALQSTRYIYNIAIQLLLQCDHIGHDPYHRTLSLLKDMNRPFLATCIYESIKDRFQEVTPHLMADFQTMPIAFLLLENLQYEPKLLHLSAGTNRQSDEEERWRSSIRHMMQDLAFDLIAATAGNSKDKCWALLRMMEILTTDGRRNGTDTLPKIKKHKLFRREYERLIKDLETREPSRKVFRGNDRLLVLSTEMIGQLLSFAIETRKTVSRHQTLPVGSWHFALMADMIALLDTRERAGLIPDSELVQVHTLVRDISTYLAEELTTFFTVQTVTVIPMPDDSPKIMDAERWENDIRIYLVDWGSILLHLQSEGLLAALITAVKKTNRWLVKGTQKYDPVIRRYRTMLKLYFQILMKGYIRIRENQGNYGFAHLPVKATESLLWSTITEGAIRNSREVLSKRAVDIFEDKHVFHSNHLYVDKPITLLYKCVNCTTGQHTIDFVRNFCSGNTNLERLLLAANTLEKEPLKKIVADRLAKLTIKDFDKASVMDELFREVLYSVNSTSYWQRFTQPLLDRFKKELERKDRLKPNYSQNLYQIELLLAVKQKDVAAFQAIADPVVRHLPADRQRSILGIRNYFWSAYLLDRGDADGAREAVTLLTTLVAENPKTPDYAVLLFRGKTRAALLSDWSDQEKLLAKAYSEWEYRYNASSEEFKKALQYFADHILYTKIFYFARMDRFEELQTAIPALPESQRYDEDIIALVGDALLRGGRVTLALDYINGCTEYYTVREKKLPETIYQLESKTSTEQAIKELRTVLQNLPGRQPRDIPRILPPIHNSKSSLDAFLNKEIIQAALTMCQKIHGLHQNTYENRFTDLLVAILKLRLALLGWTVSDQDRSGNSVGGKDAGEVDLTWSAAAMPFAIGEALIYRDKGNLQRHILKMMKYNPDVENYYVICYLTSKTNDLDTKWATYKQIVAQFDFFKAWHIGKRGETIVPIPEFDSTASIRCAKMTVGGKKHLYHILIKIPYLLSVKKPKPRKKSK